ncbi:MAG TPA: vanadium-dependent haloperoxidase [Thermoanaerobaculia bacterium]|nr:vanadium-dependent haloperoxidase [Thermoanaerobaculia bacterium]
MESIRDNEQPEPGLDLNRRQFLGGIGGVTVGSLAGGLVGVGAATVGARQALADEIGPEELGDRLDTAERIREDAARAEKQLGVFPHTCNGDEALYPSRIGSYHKALPHDADGFVDTDAYDALRGAIESGQFADFEAVPLGGITRLLNPLAAIAFNLEGPDNAATVGAAPAPALASAERAAEAAELYWMALCRDIPFSNYATDATIADACADLSNLPGYKGPKDGGIVTPQVLFRWQAPGVLNGPMTSQFLLRNWVFDGVTVTGRVNTAAVGGDFMTEWNEFLAVQNGGGGAATPPLDPVLRFPRSGRDLAMVAAFDKIYTAYLKACHILLQFPVNFATGAFLDAAWPYKPGGKMAGFGTFGLAWLLENVAAVGKAERHTWYQKWQVHRTTRPEAYGGLVHKAVAEGFDLPIHSDLTDVSTVLPRVFAANQARNAARGLGAVGTYLLSQHLRLGCPTHPSYPAGHAFSAGVSVTFLKAVVDEAALFPGAVVKPSADGTATTPYVAGVDGPALTVGGELNKLAHNLSFGRDMSGVHWRSDDVAGLLQGEEVAIRYLHEQKATYAEPFTGFSLTKFDGTTIVI